MNDFLEITTSSLPIHLIILNFSLCLIISLIVSLYYEYFRAKNFGGEINFYVIFFVSIVTFFVVTVIQSSLMLSLGMVGALSIVRFRTPLKDPVDLVYLFFAVAIGVGFASGKTIISLFLSITIILILMIYDFFQKKRKIINEKDKILIITLKDINIKEYKEIADKYEIFFNRINFDSESEKLEILFNDNLNLKNKDNFFSIYGNKILKVEKFNEAY